MQIRIHDSYRKIVALSDIGLVGKTFEEGIKQIQIKPHFFKGEEKTKEEIIKILKNMHKEDATFNIVGKKSVNAAIEAGIIKENGVIKIQDVPIALVLL
jgi:hypothetical protein